MRLSVMEGARNPDHSTHENGPHGRGCFIGIVTGVATVCFVWLVVFG